MNWRREIAQTGGGYASVLARWLPKNITGQIETADDLPQDAGLHIVAFVIGHWTGTGLTINRRVVDHPVRAFSSICPNLKLRILLAQDPEHLVRFLGFRQVQVRVVRISGCGRFSHSAW